MTELEQLIWDAAAVSIHRDQCTSDVGGGVATEQLATVALADSAAVVVIEPYIEQNERDLPQFPPLVTIRREHEGEPVTLRCELDKLQNNYEAGGGSYLVIYSVEVELG